MACGSCLQHTAYHQTLGFHGTILVVSRAAVGALLEQPALQPALLTQSLAFLVWVSVLLLCAHCLQA